MYLSDTSNGMNDGRKLRMASGQMFECDYFNPCPAVGQINIRVIGVPLNEVVSIFSNSSETIQMWHEGQYAANYTHLVAIVPEPDAVRVVLGRE